MDDVKAQYEAYPYPARNPADERKRLVVGSPSRLAEVDHHLFRGRRDWSRPFRALFAGGGTGDGLIMLASELKARGCPAEIVYLDLSKASRRIAEARAAARGLEIAFHTGSLLEAARYGPFDYIDCCGVLHHLPDPQAGFDALAAALNEDGGIGAMVYAPYGRAGVYEMQAVLRSLTAGEAPKAQVKTAKAVLAALPETNALRRNPWLSDHKESDAGLYDLLLHSQDQPFTADAVTAMVEAGGLSFAGFFKPMHYDPATYLKGEPRKRAAALPYPQQAALAERLAGNMGKHVFYASKQAESVATADESMVPALLDLPAEKLASTLARDGRIAATIDGLRLAPAVPRAATAIVKQIDGARPLGEIRRGAKMDAAAFEAAWSPLWRALNGVGKLYFSGSV